MDDPDVDALRRLVERVAGGRHEVAALIHANEQTLYQILAGVPLPSGRPRSVGRDLRDRLDRAFPGWRHEVREPSPSYGSEVLHFSIAPKVPQASIVINELAELLNQLSDEARELAAHRLAILARAPDSRKARDSLVTMFEGQ